MIGEYEIGAFALGELELSGVIGTDRLYFATRDYVTLPTDTPPHRYYRGVVKSPLRVGKSVIGAGTPVENIGMSVGEIELVNGDGMLDGMISTGSLEGHEVIVSALERSAPGQAAFQQPFADARIVFRGIMSSRSYDLDLATMGVRS